MWIFTSQGFISVVAHRNHPQRLLVRARAKKHLENLFPAIKSEIQETPNADYGFRVVVERELFATWIKKQATKLDYDNFKNSIQEQVYHHAANDVWAIMMDYQRGFYHQAHRELPDRDWDLDWND